MQSPGKRSVGKPARGRQLLAALLLAFGMAALYLGIGHTPPLQEVEAQSLNWRFQLRGPVAPGPETVLLAVDDRTLAALGQWPLPRVAYAEAIQALAADGARVIAFGLLFADGRGAQERDDGAGAALPEGDRQLAEAMADFGAVIVPFAFTFTESETAARPPPAIARGAYRIASLPAGGEAPALQASGLLAAAPHLTEVAAAAHVSVLLDDDGSLRYEHPAIGLGTAFYPSLPVEAVRLYLGLAKTEVVLRFGEGIALGDRFLPTDSRMRLPVNHYGPSGSFETHSFVDLLEGRLPAGLFADRIVLIGSTALGAGGTFVSPFSRTLSGAEHHAAVIDNILQGNHLVQGDWTAALDVVAILAGSLAMAALALFGGPVVSAIALPLLLLAWSALNFAAFSSGGLWLNFTFPAAAIVASFLWFALQRHLGERRLRRDAERQRRNLARFVPSAVAASLAEQDRPFDSDQVQPAAILFLDMIGFTSLNEGMTPEEAVALLRAFHRRVERVVHAHHGVVNQIVGDGAMASFGLPQPTAEDALNALACAHALLAAIEDWRAERLAQGEAPISIGIGLHYGPVAVGEIGGEQQAQFTMTGDTVNVASRLEALTRQHATPIVASDSLIAAARTTLGSGSDTSLLDGFAELPPQAVRGRDAALGLWAWRAPLGGS